MADKMFENNQVSIIGEIVSDFQYSHEVYGEGFYMMEVSVRRLSDFVDYIPVMVSERIIDVEADYIGQLVYISGQFRSFNRHEERKNRLCTISFARELEILEPDCDEDAGNQIFLDGYICKEAIYRKHRLKGNCGSACCGKQIIRKIGLHTMYLLGQKCKIWVPGLRSEHMYRSGAGYKAAIM